MPTGLDVGESEMLPLLEELRGRGLLTKFSTLDGNWLYRRDRVDAASDRELEQLPARGLGQQFDRCVHRGRRWRQR